MYWIEQRGVVRSTYPAGMYSNTLKVILAVVYVAIVTGTASLLGLATFSAWLAFATLAAGPLIAVAVLWRVPVRTMSESIQAARR